MRSEESEESDNNRIRNKKETKKKRTTSEKCNIKVKEGYLRTVGRYLWAQL